MIKIFYKRSCNSALDKRELGWIWMNKRDLPKRFKYFGDKMTKITMGRRRVYNSIAGNFYK